MNVTLEKEDRVGATGSFEYYLQKALKELESENDEKAEENLEKALQIWRKQWLS